MLPEGKDGYLSLAEASEVSSVSGCIEKQSMRLSKGQNLAKSLEVSIIKSLENCTSDCSKAAEMFQKSSYNFGKLPADSDGPFVEGVVIRYTDSDGRVWSTDFGTANQAGSSFTIVEHIENKIDDKSEMITSAEFSCKLYDKDGGEILLQNGKIVSRSVQCN